MKKILQSIVAILLLCTTTGCTSYIAAKYDDFNEILKGEAVYSSSYGRASINMISEKSGAICTGSTPFYQGIYVYNFNLICSDGRMIMGSMYHGQYEGRAFTNRNETLSFTITKNKNKLEENLKHYKTQIEAKPVLSNKKEPMQVIVQPNKF